MYHASKVIVDLFSALLTVKRELVGFGGALRKSCLRATSCVQKDFSAVHRKEHTSEH